MNTVSKGRLRSLFSGNRPRVGNQRRSSTGLGLVNRRPKDLSDKSRLTVLRAEDLRCVGAEPSTERDDEAGTRGDDGAGTGGDDEASIGGDDGAGTGGDDGAGTGEDDAADTSGDDEPGTGGPDDEPGIGGPDDEPGTGGQDDKGAAESAARVFRIGARRLLRRAFLLALRSDTFLAFSSSESVIGPTSPIGFSIANSGLSMTSTNHGAPSSR